MAFAVHAPLWDPNKATTGSCDVVMKCVNRGSARAQFQKVFTVFKATITWIKMNIFNSMATKTTDIVDKTARNCMLSPQQNIFTQSSRYVS